MNFVLKERLHWISKDGVEAESLFTTMHPTPLTDPRDYKILLNDWPYGFEPRIRHLVIWLKHNLPVQSEGGDLTDESRALVETFIERRFGEKLGQENVLWFRNWAALQSVRALEHVHVVVRADESDVAKLLEEW